MEAVVALLAEASAEAVEVPVRPVQHDANMYYRIENIPNEQTMQAVVTGLLPLVPFSRREKALRYKHLHGQYTCLRAWQLLHELLIAHAYLPATFPLSELTYTEDEFGKPFLRISACFSLSHTKNAIAVAIDNQPIGIDVEAIASAERLADAHFLERTMNADERRWIAAATEPSVAFTELWTQKEALVKARGTGLTDLNSLPALLTQVAPFELRSAHTADYAYAIAYRL